MQYETDEGGNIRLFPLAGYTTAALPNDALLLALELVPNPAALETGERVNVQMTMTRPQARELAAALLRAAEMPYLPRA